MRCMNCGKDFCVGRSINFCDRKHYKRFRRSQRWFKIKRFFKPIIQFIFSMVVLFSIYIAGSLIIWAVEKYIN